MNKFDNLRDSCYSYLDDLEALVYSISDEVHLRCLRNDLTKLVTDYTAILDSELK